MTNISDWMKTWTGGDCSGGGDGGAERAIDIVMSDGDYYLMENGTEVSASSIVDAMYTETILFQKDHQRSVGATLDFTSQIHKLNVIILAGMGSNSFTFMIYSFPLSGSPEGSQIVKNVAFM